MRNTRKICRILAATAIACSLPTIPVCASVNSGNSFDGLHDDAPVLNYVIDFLDYDGTLLDSKICTYGEILEDIKIPERKEDGQYIYQFAGWEPEISLEVTDCVVYTAVYQRKDKSGADSEGEDGFETEPQELSSNSTKASFEGSGKEEVTQVSAISYEVIPFIVETPAGEPDASDEEMPATEGVPIKAPDLSVTPVPAPRASSAAGNEAIKESNFTKVNATVGPESAQARLLATPATGDMQGPSETPASASTGTPSSGSGLPTIAAKAVRHKTPQTQQAAALPAEEPYAAEPVLEGAVAEKAVMESPTPASKHVFPAWMFLAGMAAYMGMAWIKEKKQRHT